MTRQRKVNFSATYKDYYLYQYLSSPNHEEFYRSCPCLSSESEEPCPLSERNAFSTKQVTYQFDDVEKNKERAKLNSNE